MLRPLARVTGLEPATSGVTGRRSNQLSYTRSFSGQHLGLGFRTVKRSRLAEREDGFWEPAGHREKPQR